MNSHLHDCKRGLSTATPKDYNRWWRERARLQTHIEELEAEVAGSKAAYLSVTCAEDLTRIADLESKVEQLQAQIDAMKNCDQHYGFITGGERAEYYLLRKDVLAATGASRRAGMSERMTEALELLHQYQMIALKYGLSGQFDALQVVTIGIKELEAERNAITTTLDGWKHRTLSQSRCEMEIRGCLAAGEK